jgi:hypothetical protein
MANLTKQVSRVSAGTVREAGKTRQVVVTLKPPNSVSGNPKKRQIKKKSAKKYPCRVSKVIEIERPSEGRVRLKFEILPETEK